MPQLTLTDRVMRAAAPAPPRIADLQLVTLDNGDSALVSTTRYGGELVVWSLTQGLERLDQRALTRGDSAGAVADLALVDLDAGPALILGGGSSGALVRYSLGGGGRFGGSGSLGGSEMPGDLVDIEPVRLPGGGLALYGGIAGGSGLARLTLDGSGAITGRLVIADSPALHLDRVTGLAQAQSGGVTWLYAVSTEAPGISGFRVGADGGLSGIAGLGPQDNLWIAAPTALETVDSGGAAYLVVAAAGSSSLSVMRIGADGGLAVVDHVIDDLGTRFAGVSAMETAVCNGRAYVVAAGNDDGLTVFELLPGGRLLAVATLAGAGLADVTALALAVRGDGIDIYAATGSGDSDLARLRLDLGPAGLRLTAPDPGGGLAGGNGSDLLIGGAGADTLSGGGGEDVILDGGGEDAMTGGAGADVFVLARDGSTDRITDFQPGIDRLDLSAWPMLRDPGQLAIAQTDTGLRITYGDEVLILDSASGGPIDPALLRLADILGASHVAIAYEPGPDQEPLNAPPPAGTDEADEISCTPGDDSVHGLDGDDTIWGGDGHDQLWGDFGRDTIWGGNGRDMIWGGPGGDTLHGNGGNDQIRGGNGNDWIWGEMADDMLWGDAGNDRIWGGFGNDQIWGGDGDDILRGKLDNDLIWGDAGNDRIWGGVGDDRIWGGDGDDGLYGNGGSDDLAGDAGNDELWGGTGDDRLWGGDGDDILRGNGGSDRLEGGAGDDRLWGGLGADVFVFTAGRDVIVDFQPAQDRLTLDPALWSGPLDAAAVVERYAARSGDGVLFDFGGGDTLLVRHCDLAGLAALIDFL